MGPNGSKRAPGGTAPGGRMSGIPLEGSKPERGYPDLNGSTIIPPPPRDLKGAGSQREFESFSTLYFQFQDFGLLMLGFYLFLPRIIWNKKHTKNKKEKKAQLMVKHSPSNTPDSIWFSLIIRLFTATALIHLNTCDAVKKSQSVSQSEWCLTFDPDLRKEADDVKLTGD